ncbi:MAG: membrane integrity-associated transporter subunit PqiC [Fibrobacter sp.]|uniref:ABC-type transport auxiliary lipoprotein family protein n=1 Tax=uncultured Fibrobacter sp. TaxID=261512 RepID=UPI0015656EA8|nr:ABC-type transport auxiliary lipoprotein family protein [uncultured Fibrobacter sp.]MBR6317727.1 membrane integrity-associated transporter subunit PqiC [Fibrobacter sp.]
MRIFTKILTSATILLAALTLTACFGGSTSEPSRYYMLAVEDISMPSGNAKGKVQVRKFTVDPAYQKANIVYRESAYDFMFYDLDLWASRPDHMITQVVAEYAVKSGLFESVEIKGNSKPAFEISGNISAIEEVDEGSSQSARLAIEISFRKVDSNEALFEKRYEGKEPMDKREPRAMAEATSKLLGKFMEDALANMAGAN